MILAITLALVYGYLNGFLDAGGIVATIISSRALSPRQALALIAVSEFCGPLIFGVAVARTIGTGIVSPDLVTLPLVMAALTAAIMWGILTWLLGFPGSSSHALIGGLVGAILAGPGRHAIHTSGLVIVLTILLVSPIVGLAVGFLITRLIFFLARHAGMQINWYFKKSQLVTGTILGLMHGANDAQKTIGMITLILIITGHLAEFRVPNWVIMISAAAMALGVTGGGWRLIRTLGGKFFKIRPVHGFAAQISSAAVVLTAALVGSPVSTTQIISSAILGVGSAERVNKVRWGVAGQILAAWLLTIPLTVLLSALLYWFFAMIL